MRCTENYNSYQLALVNKKAPILHDNAQAHIA